MKADWNYNEPLVMLKTELHKTGKANIIEYKTVVVLLKDVPEFSHDEKSIKSEDLIKNKFGDISVLNFCEKEVIQF